MSEFRAENIDLDDFYGSVNDAGVIPESQKIINPTYVKEWNEIFNKRV